jgi:putative ABC transport system ATP-binding protein
LSSETVISLREVYKSYGRGQARTPVLRGVSLEIKKGEVVAMVGQSGSGKSTMLNIIGSLDTCDKGGVEVLGVDFAKARESRLAALRNQDIGFVFQSFNLLDHLSCIENVVLPAYFTHTSEKEAHEAGMHALERVGLKDLATRSPGELSGGQKQRVAIARALFSGPKLLLCDEPTGNLDSETGRDVIEFFGELNREDGVTLLIVTHEERLSSFAQRVIHIQDGKIESDERKEAA